MLTYSRIDVATHENVVRVEDLETGLDAIIAVHSTRRGPALGGTRFWSYTTSDHALADALALSEAMTYKNAAAELPYGGGKAVVNLNKAEKTPELLRAYGMAVESLKGTYITAEDVGCVPGDMETVSEMTKHCADKANPSSPATALGVMSALEAAIEVNYPRFDVCDCAVLIQGAGRVGEILTEMLVAAGASVWLNDINQEKVDALVKRFGVKKADDLYLPSDDRESLKPVRVFAPCALGPAVTRDNVNKICGMYKVICGAANNAVEKGIEDLIAAQGTTYCPDFVANAGGVISVHHDLIGTTSQMVVASDVVRIHSRIRQILASNIINKMEVALDFAKERLQ